MNFPLQGDYGHRAKKGSRVRRNLFLESVHRPMSLFPTHFKRPKFCSLLILRTVSNAPLTSVTHFDGNKEVFPSSNQLMETGCRISRILAPRCLRFLLLDDDRPPSCEMRRHHLSASQFHSTYHSCSRPMA